MKRRYRLEFGLIGVIGVTAENETAARSAGKDKLESEYPDLSVSIIDCYEFDDGDYERWDK
jgi:hypothetical protein